MQPAKKADGTKIKSDKTKNVMRDLHIRKLCLNICVGESGDRLTRAAKVRMWSRVCPHSSQCLAALFRADKGSSTAPLLLYISARLNLTLDCNYCPPYSTKLGDLLITRDKTNKCKTPVPTVIS